MSNKEELLKSYMTSLLDMLWVEEQDKYEKPCVCLQIALYNLHKILSFVPHQFIFEEEDLILFNNIRSKYEDIVLTVLKDISNIKEDDTRYGAVDCLDMTLNDILNQEELEDCTKGFLLTSSYWKDLHYFDEDFTLNERVIELCSQFFDDTMQRVRDLIIKQRELDNI